MRQAVAEATTHNQLTGGWRRALYATWFGALLVGCIALTPRAVGLADFFTVDEVYHWIDRVRDFSAAVRAGRWAATNLTGHPGVTTMWLGSLGRWLADPRDVPGPHSQAALTTGYLALLRLPVAVANSAAVALGYALLRRLLRPGAALLAALLWATCPFLVALSRLLHVDALAASFVTLSMLFLLIATKQEEHAHPLTRSPAHPLTRSRLLPLIGSGVCAGLAVLSKSSGLVLLPWAGLALIVDCRLQIAEWKSPGRVIRHLQSTILRYLIWLVCAALTVFALWPAMWVAPLDTFGGVIREMISNGGQAHGGGNFFLGRYVDDPGWLFYPAVVLWRSTPPLLLGLLALPLALRAAARAGERRALLALLGFVLLYGVAVSFAAKKFDRYLLPAWPALTILGAAGLTALFDILSVWVTTRTRGRNIPSPAHPLTRSPAHHLAPRLLIALLAVGLAANLAWLHPYYLSYYNPLAGGGTTAADALPVGWGEGMDQIGAWLRERPDLERGAVLSWIPETLQPFLPRPTHALDLRAQTLEQRSPPPNYAVIYTHGAGWQISPGADEAVRALRPLYDLRLRGVPYASVYQIPRPYDTPVGARFGDGLGLRGFSQERVGSTLVITPSWDVEADQPGGAMAFIHVLAPDGQTVARLDTPVDGGLFPHWQAGQQFGGPLPIALPPDLAPGAYRVTLGVYRRADGARLPLSQAPALPAEADGPHALLLTTMEIARK